MAEYVMDNTTVCVYSDYNSGGQFAQTCNGYDTIYMHAWIVYKSATGKWRMYIEFFWSGLNQSGTFSYDLVLSNDGSAINCGTPGELTPTLSYNLTLTDCNMTGTDDECTVPYSLLLEAIVT
jgi:hypothetical protein